MERTWWYKLTPLTDFVNNFNEQANDGAEFIENHSAFAC